MGNAAASVPTITLSASGLSTLEGRVDIPTYDRSRIVTGVCHIGVGGFHRAHQAIYLDEYIKVSGDMNWGLCGIGLLPTDRRMKDALTSQDYLYTVLERSAAGDKARVVGSVANFLLASDDRDAVLNQLASESTRIVSLTITEGGYCFNQATGEFDSTLPAVQADLRNPTAPQSVFGVLTEALDRRRKQGLAPFTVLSCDNIVKNGDVTKKMLLAFAHLRDPKVAAWIEEFVTFPNSMVDRITPVTTDEHREIVLQKFGIADAWPVVTEPFLQWVVEDRFCNGRPNWEKVGVQMTPDVHPYEMMKIRLLNAGHSALGYLGYLAGHRYIYEICQDPDFRSYLRAMMDEEITPLLKPVPGVDLAKYKDSLLERFSNPTIKDQATRICMDGSNKMPKFILPSIQERLERGHSIARLTLCVASWFRFLQGTDEVGKEIPLDDPMGERLRRLAIEGGKSPDKLLSLSDIFGVVGLNQTFRDELSAALTSLYENGARKTLQRYVHRQSA